MLLNMYVQALKWERVSISYENRTFVKLN